MSRKDALIKMMVKKSVSPLSSPISLEWFVTSSLRFGCPFCCHPCWLVPRGPAHLWIWSLPLGSSVSYVFAADSTSYFVSLPVVELNAGLLVLPPACFHLVSGFCLRQLHCRVSEWVLDPMHGVPMGFVGEAVAGGRQENRWHFPGTFDFQQTTWFWTFSVPWLWLGAATRCRVSDAELHEKPNLWYWLEPPESARLLQSCHLPCCCSLFSKQG